MRNGIKRGPEWWEGLYYTLDLSVTLKKGK